MSVPFYAKCPVCGIYTPLSREGLELLKVGELDTWCAENASKHTNKCNASYRRIR